VDFGNEEKADTVFRAIEPELAGTEATARVKGRSVQINLEGTETAAVRAVLNSVMRWLITSSEVYDTK
jgi:tRNA threonylcarbamoyladenosine modification (KEOPS) complex  Pcc1 subunit